MTIKLFVLSKQVLISYLREDVLYVELSNGIEDGVETYHGAALTARGYRRRDDMSNAFKLPIVGNRDTLG